MEDAKKAIEPLFVADMNNEHDMSLLKEYFGLKALEHAFGLEGTGMHEIEYNACIANLLRLMREVNENKEKENPSQSLGVEFDAITVLDCASDLKAMYKALLDLQQLC